MTTESVLEEVLKERQRQINALGWSPDHDDKINSDGQLAKAGAAYAMASCQLAMQKDPWPWPDNWWKPEGGRRDLIRAAALIVSEIERLDRKEK